MTMESSRRTLLTGVALAGVAAMTPASTAAEGTLLQKPRQVRTFGVITNSRPVGVLIDAEADSAVKHVASSFAADLERVSGQAASRPTSSSEASGPMVIIGVLGGSAMIDRMIADGRLDVADLKGEWEAYRHFGRLISVGDIRLHVVEKGPPDGRPVMLLHGFPEFWWGWRKQIDALAARGFRVVVPDMRGYGESDTPPSVEAYRRSNLVADIVGLADALSFERFDLVGHDWGGLTAWPLVGRHARRVRRLVILSAPHADTMTDELVRHPMQFVRSSYVAFFQLPWIAEAALRFDRFAALRHTLTSSARAGTFAPSDLDRYVEAWSGEGRLTAMLNYYRALRLPEAQVGRITIPTLILGGALDSALGTHLAYAAKEMCNDAELKIRPDVPHWLHLEEPAWGDQ